MKVAAGLHVQLKVADPEEAGNYTLHCRETELTEGHRIVGGVIGRVNGRSWL